MFIQQECEVLTDHAFKSIHCRVSTRGMRGIPKRKAESFDDVAVGTDYIVCLVKYVRDSKTVNLKD